MIISNLAKLVFQCAAVGVLASLTVGCSIQYADPYYGYRDDTKTFRSEGLIATMNQGGPFVRHPKRPERWKDLPAYTAQSCADQVTHQPRQLKAVLFKIQKTLPGFKTKWHANKTQLLMEIPQDSIFFVDAPHLRPDAYARLDALINIVQDKTIRIDFVGHADATGPAAYNQSLSGLRALHLQRYFVLKGISKYLTASYGLGETTPIASNTSESGRKINRRVSLIFCTIEA